MSETPKQEPENAAEKPEFWDTPEFRAGLAFVALDQIVGLWVDEHPGVTEADVDAAVAELNRRIAERDQDPPA
jgi:hypothetical protein